jgi:hypothetical protein
VEDVDEKPIKCGQLLLSLDLPGGYDGLLGEVNRGKEILHPGQHPY